MEIELKKDERVDDLQFKGLKIIQNATKFCFGTDAVLLSHFVRVGRGEQVVDLGTGTGIIPILLAGRSKARRIYGVEIQPDMAEMASRSVMLNNLGDRVEIIQGDLKECPRILGKSRFNLVVSNPPYKKLGSGMINRQDAMAASRHEILCTLEDVLRTAGSLLVSEGRFAMVHRTQRLMDILTGMRDLNLEPKRIRLIHPNMKKPPNLVLIEAVRNGKPDLKWEPPLFVYDLEGNFTPELKQIYRGDYVLRVPLKRDKK